MPAKRELSSLRRCTDPCRLAKRGASGIDDGNLQVYDSVASSITCGQRRSCMVASRSQLVVVSLMRGHGIVYKGAKHVGLQAAGKSVGCFAVRPIRGANLKAQRAVLLEGSSTWRGNALPSSPLLDRSGCPRR